MVTASPRPPRPPRPPETPNRVAVRQLSSARPLGQSAGGPVGGEHQPWSVPLRFFGASNSTLTIVPTTGGHVQQVERSAVQGVRA